MRLFYDEHIAGGSKSHVLNEEESAHILRVLRMKVGDKLEIVNGKGSSFICQIEGVQGKQCLLKIESEIYHELDKFNIHIAIAPTKQMERLEWLVEKATEIGITKLTILSCKNDERGKVKMDRLLKKAISALKQSKRFYLPQIEGVIDFKTFVKLHPSGLIAHCEDQAKEKFESVWKSTNCPILIGPEGDFTKEEIKFAEQNQYKSVTLGVNRLRTETAGLYACMQAKLLSDQ